MGWGPSLRAAWGAFWPSRLVVFGVAVYVAVAGLDPSGEEVAGGLLHPFGAWPAHDLFDLVFSTPAKWDAVHFLTIAYDGYSEGSPISGTPEDHRAAFFPLYPGAVHVLSGFGASLGATLVMAYAVSLACFFGALVLLHRLTTIEIGERYATPTLLLLSFFPTALFFGLPYSESMFLLLAVAAFLAARTGHWAIAGVVLALASATRAPGLLLVVPVLLLYLYGPRTDREPDFDAGRRPRYRVRPDLAWLLLAPLGLAAFSAYLHLTVGDGLAWSDAQTLFGRHTVDPFSGAWAGLWEAGQAADDIAGGSRGGFGYLNVMQLAFVAFAVAGGIGALRVLPAAYGAWVLISLVPVFVSQPDGLPLWSSPRFVAVLFPLFLGLAVLTERRGITTHVVALFAAGMAVFTAQFTLWSFVA